MRNRDPRYSDEEFKVQMKKNYRDGYNTGKRWEESYRPGGPFHSCAQTNELNTEWLRGFDNALENRNVSS